MNILYSTKSDLNVVGIFLLMGVATAGFFFEKATEASGAKAADLNSAGLLLIILALFLLVVAAYWVEVELAEDKIILRRVFFGKRFPIEIEYKNIQLVDISDYLGTIKITESTGMVSSISGQVRKVRGDLPEIWIDREPLPAPRARDLHMLRYELQRRAQLI